SIPAAAVAAAAVEHPRARSIRRATSPRPQGTRSCASSAKLGANAKPRRFPPPFPLPRPSPFRSQEGRRYPFAPPCHRQRPFVVAGETGDKLRQRLRLPAQLSNSYHAANAARTETIARSRGGIGRPPRSEVSKARDRSGPGSVDPTR